jgi:sortase (surface protein transpeptidase)
MRARVWVVLVVLLAGTAALLVTLAVHPAATRGAVLPPDAPTTTSEATPPATRTTTVPATAGVTPVTPAPSSAGPAGSATGAPAHLSIPAIGVSTDLVRLGLRPDTTVEVPQDPARAGWYESGTVPGQPGSAVVLGHVDSVEGPAVFYRLAQLQRGDLVRVGEADGSVATFVVRRVATYANDDFPAEQVYAGDPDRRFLNLVTCGGWYDADRGGWQGNVVVYSELTSR